MKRVFILLGIILLVTSCASKRYAKKAAKFEEAGLYQDAAEYYYQSVKKKDSNVEAKLGLRKNGQLTLEKKLADFTEAYKRSDYKQAVYNYVEAEKYYNKITAVGVELSFPEYHKDYYEEAKGDYLGKRYADGVEKLDREEFAEALKVFDEIVKIDPEYKDVKDKFIVAKYEPMYREGNQMLDNGLYRSAYYKFDAILNGAGTYKQVIALKEEALEKATITVLVPGFTSTPKYRNEAITVTSKVRGELNELKNPFIKVIDVSSVSRDIIDPRTGKLDMTAANLSGIKAILTGHVVKVEKRDGGMGKEEKRGYLKQVEKYKTESGEEKEKVTYHKTIYFEYKQKNTASLEISYKMVSTDNNEILISDVFQKSNTDQVHYATYEGNKDILIPGYWKYKDRESSEDVVKDNSTDRNKLKNLLKADKSIKSSSTLLNELYNNAMKDISKKVDNYNPEN